MKNISEKIIHAAESIRSGPLMKHVRTLASSGMRGRMPGDFGYELASTYVENCFSSIDLEPFGDDGTYRQRFNLETNLIRKADAKIFNPNGSIFKLDIGTDFICRGLSAGAKLSAGACFVGYGETEPDCDELKGVDLAGKIVLAFKLPRKANAYSPEQLPRARAHRLIQKGARGLVLLPNPNTEKSDRLSASLMESQDYIPGFPILTASEETALRLMSFDEMTFSSRQYSIDAHRHSASHETPWFFDIDIQNEWNPKGESWNLLGLLRGVDPILSREAIVIGAHLDHVGIQGESAIFHGAQDNASGVAALIEIAKAIASSGPMRRSILFIAFSAEESGIIGSKFYAMNPPWFMNDVSAMINLDCMGAGTGLDVRGRKDHAKIFRIFDELNQEHYKIEDDMTDHPAGGADAEVFQQAGVPNMFIVAKNPYQHLHMRSDTPDTLNSVLFQSISRLTCSTAIYLSDTDSSIHPPPNTQFS